MAKLLAFILLLIAVFPTTALAHPHAFIDLRTTLVLNEKGEVTAVKEHWIFDQYYTEFALHDFGYKKGGALDHDKVMELAHENLKGLKDFQYFTSFADKQIKVTDAADVNSYLEDNRIAMDFTLKLFAPAKLPFAVRIYDPSYYTAMLHVKDGLKIQGTLPNGCDSKILKSNPNTVWVNLASALDRNAKAPDDLGTYFAEKVSITCQ